MATTPNYNLPLIPDNAVNDVKRDFNSLSVAVDGAIKSAAEGVNIPLSDATDGTRSGVAGSEKAVGLVMQAATAAGLAAATAQATATTAQSTANAAETPTGAQTKVNNAVGNLASLQTAAKGNAVAAINELFTSASNGKTAVAAAITGKGVPASGSDTFGQLAQKIGQIPTGLKVVTGSVSLNGGVGSITNIPFRPRILLCYLHNYSYTGYTANAEANAYVVAYDLGEGVVYGRNFSGYVKDDVYTVNFTHNIYNVVFGENSVSFTSTQPSGVFYILFGT